MKAHERSWLRDYRVGAEKCLWDFSGDNWGKGASVAVSGCGQAAGSSQQSARSVWRCGQLSGSSQHGLSQDVDNLDASASTVCLNMWTSSWLQSAVSTVCLKMWTTSWLQSAVSTVCLKMWTSSWQQSAVSTVCLKMWTSSSQQYTEPACSITCRENLDYQGTY